MKILLAMLILAWGITIRADEPPNSPDSPDASRTTVETIVMIRHAEKPPGGLGQLNCRGLNRALALPKVLVGKFGVPQYIFAPDPSEKADHGNYYVRPLTTIEPTAIRCGLPVNTGFGFMDIAGLERELQKSKYQNATIFIAWEHILLDLLAKDLVKTGGGSATHIPAWSEYDFDTIFVIKITRSDQGTSVAFSIDHEGLDNLSDNCP